MKSPFDKILDKLIKNIKMRPVNILDVKEFLNIYEISNSKKIKSSIEIIPLYRICFATTINGEDVFTIYDPNITIDRGKNELSLELMKKGVEIKDGKKTLQNQDLWNSRVIGKLVKSCNKLDVKDFFKIIQELKIEWKTFLDYLIDDTGKKDERIINIAKATYMPSPDINSFYASINNHAIVVSNSGVGKSTTFSRLTGKQPEADYSIPGLVGTIIDNKVTGGSLNGKGIYVFDEFPQTNETRSMVVASLLNYMESGETIRDLAQKIYCKGTKTLIFLGNVPREYNEKNFEEILLKLAGQDAFQRVGRRIAHVLFKLNFKEINPSHENPTYISFLRYVLESAITQNTQKIRKIYSHFKNWLFEEDEEYINTIKSFIRFSSFKLVSQFLEGNARAYTRIKNGAIKWTILENLDKITLNKANSKELIAHLEKEIKRNYETLKNYNYDSYEFLQEGKKAKAIEMFKIGKTETEIAEELDISDHTVKKWIKDYEIFYNNRLKYDLQNDINELKPIK